MKEATQTVNADSAPIPGLDHGLSVVSQCSQCKKVSGKDLLGVYEGVLVCDACANDLKPDLYNAYLEDIIACADCACVEELGIPVSQIVKGGIVALIEDDMGDLAYMSPNCHRLFMEAPALGGATSDFLPTEIRLTHRAIHREAIRTQVKRDCVQTAIGKHWICKILPFIAAYEVFTLTLFQLTV